MNPQNVPRINVKMDPTEIAKKVFLVAKYLMVIILCTILSIYLFSSFETFLSFKSSDVFALWVIGFLMALMTKANYTIPLFLFDLLLCSVVLAITSFGQAFFLLLLLVLLQKKVKMI